MAEWYGLVRWDVDNQKWMGLYKDMNGQLFIVPGRRAAQWMAYEHGPDYAAINLETGEVVGGENTYAEILDE